jgi:hypothetical protein
MASQVAWTSSGGVVTTGAVQDFIIGTITVPESGISVAEVTVIAKSADDIHAMWKIIRSARRNGTAGAAAVGSEVDIITAQKDASASTWDVELQISGNTMLVGVTGAAAKTVTWFGEVRVVELGL